MRAALGVVGWCWLGLVTIGCGGGDTPGDVTPPVVTSTSPAANAVAVQGITPITILFSEQLDAATVTPATILVSGIEGQVNLSGNTATFTPSVPMNGAQLYTVTAKGAVQDLAGNPMGADHIFSFTTGAPPSVQSSSPTADATEIPAASPISVTFNEAMAASSFTAQKFTVAHAGGNATGTISVVDNVATFTPSPPLAWETSYTVTVDRFVLSASGTPLSAAHTFAFQTGDAPPTVTSTVPASGATGVAQDATITITFNEPMLDSSLSAANFLLQNVGTGLPVGGQVTAGSSSLEFVPDALSPGTTYRATVQSEVANLNGTQMAADHTFTFTTAE